MFEHIILEGIQKELLNKLVEIERSLPHEKRGKFYVSDSWGTSEADFIHSGGPKLTGHMSDIEVLAGYNFLNVAYGSRETPNFYVTPVGFRFYEYLKNAGEPIETVETEYRKYLSSDEFEREYPEAYAKWSQAEKFLWGNDSQQNFTTIGHLCREAMQEYAEALLKKFNIPEPHPPKANTVGRLRSVIEVHQARVGTTVFEFLNALIPYWGTVNDLAQRQEHGAQREEYQLIWEDARRLVFQSLVVFYEIDRALRAISIVPLD